MESLEDRASSSGANPERCAPSDEPPARCMGGVPTVKERARAALALLTELDEEEDAYRTPEILKRYDAGVIKIDQREIYSRVTF